MAKRKRPDVNPGANKRASDKLAEDINKAFGSQTIVNASKLPDFRHVRTGIFTLDVALLGGIPEGLATCFYGWPSAGKTTAAIKAIAGFQKKYPKKRVLFVDVEGTFDPVWAEKFGVDVDALMMAYPGSGEQAIDIVEAALRANDISLVVLDSIAMMTATKEIEQSAEDKTMGTQGALLSLAFRKWTNTMTTLKQNGVTSPTFICINQFREKMVLMGDSRTLPGGHAQHFMYAVKVELKNKETLGETGQDVKVVDYNDHSFKVTKNKTGNSIREGEYLMYRNPDGSLPEGFIDSGQTVVNFARKYGLVTGDGGSAKRLMPYAGGPELPEDGMVFKRFQDIVDWLYEDYDNRMVPLEDELISIHREAMNRPKYAWKDCAPDVA